MGGGWSEEPQKLTITRYTTATDRAGGRGLPRGRRMMRYSGNRAHLHNTRGSSRGGGWRRRGGSGGGGGRVLRSRGDERRVVLAHAVLSDLGNGHAHNTHPLLLLILEGVCEGRGGVGMR